MNEPHTLTMRVAGSLAEIPAGQWDALAGSQPFLRHGFLHAFERSGCVGPGTGWTPCHLTLWEGGRLAAALPLYEKTHSLGEFVFDWSWAEAWERAGGRYYPKLLTGIPFTPVAGRRLLADGPAARTALIDQALAFARARALSSWHVTFPGEADLRALAAAGLHLRRSVQFHWHNDGYAGFEDFLGALHRDKRKKIRQERRRVREAGVAIERIPGHAVSEADWDFFYRCHRQTYAERGRQPYLSAAFFLMLAEAMPDNLVLVLARRGGEPLAAALDVFDAERLYGRYWGAVEHVPGLHFEVCYYQGIEFCIERGLSVFEGGAQGEHKLARGLAPVLTHSAHWIADAGFSAAVGRFLAREAAGVAAYVEELDAHSPFRVPGNDAP